ncbi:pyrroline-5-carboxylate reductase [PVC group bacterium (ex Bugula neritina AB1)]|nr:pyrroline-5-carboxylate reductase [PVC group bacterium (ex Bugula neritina AB1)]
MTMSVGFLGAGAMAEALIKGVVDSKMFEPENILISDISPERIDIMKKKYKVTAVDEKTLLEKANILVLAVKPNIFDDILPSLQKKFHQEICYVSIMAGITIDHLKKIGLESQIIRVMPNLCSLIGTGMNVLSKGKKVDPRMAETVENIFRSVGKALWMDESKMDVVTAVSGSGPAYVFRFAEAMIRAGVEHGLTENESATLVKQTFLGSANVIDHTDETMSDLVRKVSSPGGTTVAGLSILEKKNFADMVDQMIEAAKNRSKELGGNA